MVSYVLFFLPANSCINGDVARFELFVVASQIGTILWSMTKYVSNSPNKTKRQQNLTHAMRQLVEKLHQVEERAVAQRGKQ